ncbi:MAG: ABC transporter ATP-binding protein [Planctomycetaceae bacterium]|nr:ABC transporter ATP-binding protein [Planctomycetaceae bacterium]
MADAGIAEQTPEGSRPLLVGMDAISLVGSERPRLDGVTCDIHAGVTAIIGLSGAGKTSLLNLLSGFESPSGGRLHWNRQMLDGDLPMYWVPQGGGLWPQLSLDAHLAVVGANATSTAVSSGSSRFSEISDELLHDLHLTHRRRAVPAELSEGERSRLAVARALISGARVLIMDEPLAHVDQTRKHQFWNVIRDWLNRRSAHLIFASHDPDVIVREAGDVLCLEQGRVVYSGSVNRLYHAATKGMPAELLGRVNWLDQQDLVCWRIRHAAVCEADLKVTTKRAFRPERLVVVPQPESPLEIVFSNSFGSDTESRVIDVETGAVQLFVHQTPQLPTGSAGRQYAPGTRVELRLV